MKLEPARDFPAASFSGAGQTKSTNQTLAQTTTTTNSLDLRSQMEHKAAAARTKREQS